MFNRLAVLLLLSCKSSLCILDTIPRQIYILQLFSPYRCLAPEGPVGVSDSVCVCMCVCKREKLASWETLASEFNPSLLACGITGQT